MNWADNSFTRALGLRYPIVQGPFGGHLSSVELVALVSNFGALGSYGAHMLSAAQIVELADDIRKRTDRPFNLNLWASDHDPGGVALTPSEFEAAVARYRPYYDELGIDPPPMPASYGERFENQFQGILDARPPVFSFVFGIPAPWMLEACRKRRIRTLGTVTTVEEAVAMEDAGVDMLVATGMEAGGHRPSFLRSAEDSLTGTFALIPLVADRVRIPVIAAGGIADGRGIAGALALGAEGVQIGTAFLACEESNTSDLHRDLLFGEAGRDTVLTRAFTGRLSRGIRNRFVEEQKGHHLPFPAQSWFASTIKAAALKQGRADLISAWAGQVAPLVRHRRASTLLESLTAEAGRRCQPMKEKNL